MPNTSDDARVAKGQRFRELHNRQGVFVIPNPWDVGSARLLAKAGFEALATTSAGAAASAGVADGRLSPVDCFAHVGVIADATDLPVSADLENCYGDDPATVAATISAAANAGAVGGSVEDLAGPGTLYEFGHAVERVRAAVDAARALPFDFTVTARCESLLTPSPDLDEAIRRLQAFQEVGADVLYAPGLTSLDQVHAVVSSVDRPVNVVVGLGRSTFTVEQLGEAGVRRISVGSALARLAYGSLLRAIEEISTAGTFGWANDGVPYGRLMEMLAD